MFVAPETSPRGEGVPDDAEGAYDFGLGAGFYVDATEQPFARHYRLYSYIKKVLPPVIAANFAAAMGRQSTTAHSMGGAGASTYALTYPGQFNSTSATAPTHHPPPRP